MLGNLGKNLTNTMKKLAGMAIIDEEVVKEVTKIVEKPVEVVKVETVYTHDQETKNMITSIFNYFAGQFKSFTKYIKKG